MMMILDAQFAQTDTKCLRNDSTRYHQFICLSGTFYLDNESSISMVVRKASRRLFQLRHLSHGEHASDSDAILATTAKKDDEDINVNCAGGLALSPLTRQVIRLLLLAMAMAMHERVSLLVTN